MIMAGLVEVDEVRVDKAGHLISSSSTVSLKKPYPPYVSRGGLKLEAALDQFSVDIKGKVMLDVGSSTGGFADCLLQAGARRVYCLDVGKGQLAWKLREDPRVTVMEGFNARYLVPGDLPQPPDLITIDLSFISLQKVLPAAAGNREFFILLSCPA